MVAWCATNGRYPGGIKKENMATEGHERGQRGDHQKKSKVEIDEELVEIRARMEQLTLKIQHETKTRWTYEWPLKRKEKWLCQKLLARKQQQELRKWLRHDENLSDRGRVGLHM
jgi:methyl coenzyme M reductase subunit D